jgi:cardiolipin synthase
MPSNGQAITGGPLLEGVETTNWLTIPNLLTAFRLMLTIPFLYFVVHGRDVGALIVFVVAGLSDCLDGFLARRLDQSSLLGRLVDPAADKVLTCSAFVALAFFHPGSAMPEWVAMTAVARDVLIVIGSLAVYVGTQNSAFRPSFLGKFNTVVEILVVVLFLSSPLSREIANSLDPLYIILALSIVLSFGSYVLQGASMYRAFRLKAHRSPY